MKASWTTGLSFGLTSGVITTLGLIVGLHSGTHSRMVVMAGIITIAISDAMSDALGIHISEEARNRGSARHVWEATLATFLSKFVIAMTFLFPIVLYPLGEAIVISVMWGVLLLAALSYFVAGTQALSPWRAIVEHLIIACLVVAASYAIGSWIKDSFTTA
jgi:VIT1/CCC1 family predicted Fe2+/Mn2+ transporter